MHKIRLEKKKTQKQLSIMCGLSQGYISDLESGNKSPTLRVVEQIANVLKVHPCELIEIKEQIQKK